MKRLAAPVLLLVVAVALAGCGGSTKSTTTTTTPAPPKTTSVRVYLLLHGKVQPVARDVPDSSDLANAAFGALLSGPTPAEQKLGLTTAMPKSASWTVKRTPDGVLSLSTEKLSRPALAQTVYTLTQFPTTETVVVNGKQYSRSVFEDETPAILVESPLAFQVVTSPLHATGTANTFEATFQYDLVNGAGTVVKTHFVTATSGTGTRGTFEFSVPFTAGNHSSGSLVVYEISAKDGSRINEIGIPLKLS